MLQRSVAASAALVGIVVLAIGASTAGLGKPEPISVPPTRTETQIREANIAFYRKRVDRDSIGARDRAELARLHLQRARETGANSDLVEAEALARRSLALRESRNSAAFGVLASSLLAQHRFADAADAARRLVDRDSTSIAARALLAETQMELGRYDDARRTFGQLKTYRTDLSVAPRLARWLELEGQPEQARQLLRRARDDAEQRHAMPTEQLAWFRLRLGDLALRYGHLGEADREFRAGLALAPDDYRLLGAMARLETARHRWARAIEYGERAVAVSLDPATLGVISDAYAASGDPAKAAEYAHVMEVAVLGQPGPYHRAWSLFLLDHDREGAKVLANVRDELASRRDVYGFDLLAWALYQQGRHREARSAMKRALALGTREAMLFYHAGMIELALGDEAAARTYLEDALETNAHWHPFQTDRARTLLDSIRTR